MSGPANETLPSISLARLRDDVETLAAIGRDEVRGGVSRLAFTDEDARARTWLLRRIEDAGGRGRIDEAGNVIGRFFDAGEDAPALVIGSHIDTVVAGGPLDGALGVLCGLECARAVAEAGVVPARPLEVVAFADEEGRFGGMLGSQAFAGVLPEGFVERAVSIDDVPLENALRTAGLDPAAVPNAARAPDDIHAFLELHIEQGPVLDARGAPVGVVSGISGVFVWVVRLLGAANHAGTTPMALRKDAFAGLAAFCSGIDTLCADAGSDITSLTVGRVEVSPGYAHTVPGEVEFSLVGRDLDETGLRALAERARAALEATAKERGLGLEIVDKGWLWPTPCHPAMVALLERAAAARGIEALRMPSGAGHDAQNLARLTRAGLLFVPSVDGLSHAPDERTRWEDVQTGANVLLTAALELLG